MGADATAAVAVYAAPEFEEDAIRSFVRGAREVCSAVGAEYVGGDLDDHEEFTVATTAVGRTDDPVLRSGARRGDLVCVTGTLGRSAAAVRLFEAGEVDRANELFRFTPRIAAGRVLRAHATAMMDSSDGLARSLHQLAEASGCGVAVEFDRLPVDDAVEAVADGDAGRRELSVFYGEDFELVCTLPETDLAAAREQSPVPLVPVGRVVGVDDGITGDGDPLPDRGYTHGT
jgi:thiamine-monophosphate kinase